MEDDSPLITSHSASPALRISKRLFLVGILVGTFVLVGLVVAVAVLAGRSERIEELDSEHVCLLKDVMERMTKLEPGVFKENRNALWRRWKQVYGGNNTVLYFEGNGPLSLGDSDTHLLFQQNSPFLYVAGADIPDVRFVLYESDGSLESVLFVSGIDAVWDGVALTPEEWSQKYAVNQTLQVSDMTEFFNHTFTTDTTLFTLSRYSVPSEWKFPKSDQSKLGPILTMSREIKGPKELEVMSAVSELSSSSHTSVMRFIRNMTSENQVEAFYLFKSYNCLLRKVAYTTIVGYGYHSAILHYSANDDPMVGNGLVLIDAGSEYLGYSSDITRTYPISGKFSKVQKDIYNAVLDAQTAAHGACRAGRNYTDMVDAAFHSIGQSLYDLGYLNSDEPHRAALGLFMPHGLSHQIGLDVHDIGGLGVLQANQVITIEPGIYFNKVKFSGNVWTLYPELVKAKIEPMLDDFGGVRIEDVYIIENTGCKMITNVPKTVNDVEKTIQSGVKEE